MRRRSLLFAGLVLVIACLVREPAWAQSAVHIVALGASNTAGWGVAPDEAYPSVLQRLLKAKGVDATIVNAGIPGDTTGGMLGRLDGVLTAGTRVVILQPGTNDAGMGQGEQRMPNIAAIRARLQARNIKLLMLDEDTLAALPRSELRDDGIHFTPKGYALLADMVLPGVLAALGQ